MFEVNPSITIDIERLFRKLSISRVGISSTSNATLLRTRASAGNDLTYFEKANGALSLFDLAKGILFIISKTAMFDRYVAYGFHDFDYYRKNCNWAVIIRVSEAAFLGYRLDTGGLTTSWENTNMITFAEGIA